MPVPSFPQLPDDDPIASLRLVRDYLRDLEAYFSPIKIAISLVALTMVACAVAYWALGFDSTLSWASDFVPLLFAVVGIVVSVKKLRDEHQAAVISFIVIVGVLGTVVEIEPASVISGPKVARFRGRFLEGPTVPFPYVLTEG